MRAWRISRYTDLLGIGGRHTAGRWNHLGRLIVYCADHPALALLEILVHVDIENLPEDYKLLEISIPDQLIAKPDTLPENWMEDFAISRNVFENFCQTVDAPVLLVPSVIVSRCSNLLINPNHPRASELQVVSTQRQSLDTRFLR